MQGKRKGKCEFDAVNLGVDIVGMTHTHTKREAVAHVISAHHAPAGAAMDQMPKQGL